MSAYSWFAPLHVRAAELKSWTDNYTFSRKQRSIRLTKPRKRLVDSSTVGSWDWFLPHHGMAHRESRDKLVHPWISTAHSWIGRSGTCYSRQDGSLWVPM